jgi:hypothetical protein
MASDDQEELERLLFGVEQNGSLRPGLIAKAAKSAIFLDEVHQPENKENTSTARAALLRPLESREFIPKGSGCVCKVDDVLFIMGTSKTRKDLQAYKPVDFWTRMTHFIEISHPLAIYDAKDVLDCEKVNDVLEKFFNFFWWERVEDLCEGIRRDNKEFHSYSEKILARQRAALDAVVREGWSETTMGEEAVVPLPKRQPTPGAVFATALQNTLREQGVPADQCSIRGIRNIVIRLFYICATRVAQGEHVLKPPPRFRSDVIDIAREIIPLADLSASARVASARSLPTVVETANGLKKSGADSSEEHAQKTRTATRFSDGH